MAGSSSNLRRIGQQIGSSLAAPLGTLITIPVLVLAVGLFTAFNSYSGICSTVDTIAKETFSKQSELAVDLTQTCFSVGPRVLNLLEDQVRHSNALQMSDEMLARRLHTLMSGRLAVIYVSISEPDGRFRGLNLHADDGYLFISSKITDAGKTEQQELQLQQDGTLNLKRQDLDYDYDPRQRPFYKLAEKNGTTAWTDPYAFYGSGVPGITCTKPVYDEQGAIQAVLTVDFHINSLGDFLKNFNTVQGGMMFLFTADKQILAHPQVRVDEGHNKRGRGTIPVLQELNDPRLSEFCSHHPEPNRIVSTVHFNFDSMNEHQLASVTACPIPSGPTWYIGTVAPQSAFIGDATEDLKQSVIASSLGLLIAVIIALLFARHLVRNRRAVLFATAAAQKAQEQVREMGSYRLVKKLGAGGMGEVWRGEHRMLARPAAVKLIHDKALQTSDHEDTTTVISRFEREAQAIASLNSLNTVRLYDYGVSKDRSLYYVMELLDGIDLEVLIEQHGPQPPGRVINLLQQICNSLTEAHDKGLIHRDIKPANIYICRMGEDLDIVKVLDFGMVRQVEEEDTKRLTMQNLVVGTPAYMAPEQAQGDEASGASVDIYAVGCVAYWLLTGTLVFDGNTGMEILLAKIDKDPEPISKRCPTELPPRLEQLIMACLAKEPGQRPSNVRLLREALLEIELPADQRWQISDSARWWSDHGPCPPPASDTDTISGQLLLECQG